MIIFEVMTDGHTHTHTQSNSTYNLGPFGRRGRVKIGTMIFSVEKKHRKKIFLIHQQKQGGDHQENKISGRIQRDPLP